MRAPGYDELLESALPWSARASAMPWLPGTPEQLPTRLGHLLKLIATDELANSDITWPDTSETVEVKSIMRSFGRSGFARRASDRACGFELTDSAAAWLASGDNDTLIAIFHANVRFVGELLRELSTGSTHEKLRLVAGSKYGLPWRTLDQVRRRTTWLRATGHVELWTNLELVLTDAGRTLAERLEVVDHERLPHNVEEVAGEVELPDAPPGIAALLENLDQARLSARKRAISYIPGGESVDSLERLVRSVYPQASREDFYKSCEEQFSISRSSADSALSAIRTGGLVEQIGPSTFSATEVAAEWMESDEPIDLVRILHSHITGIGECLAVLEEPQGSGSISRALTTRYGIATVPTTDITRRVRLLHSAGLIDRITQFSYRLNAAGRAALEELPLLDEVGADSTPRAIDKSDALAGKPAVDESVAVQSLGKTILDAGTDASHYEKLERAVASAFEYLGFSAQHMGAAGRTDVLLSAWVAPGQAATIIVDAKSSASGIIDERAVQLEVLEEHRARHEAEYVAVVGPHFSPRLRQWATNRSIALITTADLAAWTRRHAQAPISPSRYLALFNAGESKKLRTDWEATNQRRDVLAGVVQKLWECANDPTHLRVSKGALNARDLWLLLRGDHPDAQLSDIEAALSLLSSELVGAVARGKQDFYTATEPPGVVAKKLASLSGSIEPVMPEAPKVSQVPDQPSSSQVSSPAVDPTAVRAWARENGINVSERGRLSSALVSQYLSSSG